MADLATFEDIREEWNAEGLPNINSGLPDWSDNPITPCMVSLGDQDWPSPVRIINIVASEAGLSVRTLKSSRQDPHSIMARHIAVYFLRELRALSTPQIGQLMDKDHTTIMYALNRVEQKIRRDPDYLQFHDRVLAALREMQ